VRIPPEGVTPAGNDPPKLDYAEPRPSLRWRDPRRWGSIAVAWLVGLYGFAYGAIADYYDAPAPTLLVGWVAGFPLVFLALVSSVAAAHAELPGAVRGMLLAVVAVLLWVVALPVIFSNA
jgi:hypothetical protein